MLAVLRQRNFALLWAGGLISMLGDWLLFIALPFYIYDLTGSALATGAMFMAETLPILLFGSIGGVFADRWDRKKTMIVADLLRAALLLLLLAAGSAEWLWAIYLVVFVQSSVGQFFNPAKGALTPQLVDEQQLMPANSLNSVGVEITRLIGAPLGGALMTMMGLSSVVLVDCVSFVVSALLILSALGFLSAASWAWADFSWAWALATAARCAAISAGCTLPSLACVSLVLALSSAACALATCSSRSRASSWASGWLALTRSPSFTSTCVTLPLVGNVRSSDCAAATVPLPATLATMLPLVIVVVDTVGADELLLVRVSRSATMIANTIAALPIQSQRVRLMPCRRRESVVVAIPCVPFQN